MPHIQVCATFYLKDAPKGQPGLSQESWTFGKTPVALDELLGMFTYQLLDFYLSTMQTPTEQINMELSKFKKALESVKVTEAADDLHTS
jgi:hypothetical protein